MDQGDIQGCSAWVRITKAITALERRATSKTEKVHWASIPTLAELNRYDGPAPESERRYSPAECTGAHKYKIEGNPGPKHVSTSYSERLNLNVRMGNRRMTRLTNAFSKKAENHAHMMAIYFMHYNFVRIHQTTKVIPAIPAGVTSKLWEMCDMVRVLENWEVRNANSYLRWLSTCAVSVLLTAQQSDSLSSSTDRLSEASRAFGACIDASAQFYGGQTCQPPADLVGAVLGRCQKEEDQMKTAADAVVAAVGAVAPSKSAEARARSDDALMQIRSNAPNLIQSEVLDTQIKSGRCRRR